MNLRFALLLMLVLCVSSALSAKRTRARGPKKPKGNCHLKELDACGAQLDRYKNDTAAGIQLLSTSAGLDTICSNSQEVLACMRKFLETCGTQIQRELYDFAIEGFSKPIDRFCKPGKDRDEFLQSSPCISENVLAKPDYKADCVTNFLATLDKINKVEDMDDRLDTVCCSYNRWEDCLMGKIESKCEAKGKAAMEKFMSKAFGRLSQMVCNRKAFNPTSDRCNSLYAPAGATSKGDTSDNPITRYLAQYFSFLF